MRLRLVILLLSLASIANAQLNTTRLMQIGRNAVYFEDYVLGMQYFNRVISVKPYLAEPYYYRAIAKYSLDDVQGALADCNIAVQMNPFLIGAYNLAGIILLRQDKSKDAIGMFEKGLGYEADNIALLQGASIANINLQNYAEAIRFCDKVLGYDARNVQALLYKGIANVQNADSVAALANFEHAASINSYSPDAQNYLGMLHYQMQHYEQALIHYDRLIELRPREAGAYINRALARYNIDDYNGCFADLDQAISLDPRNLLAYQNRGILNAQVGKLEEAADDYSHVLALDSDNDIALMNRAVVYIQSLQYRKALADLDIIIARHPEFPDAYQQRAVCRENIGDRQGAQLDYNTAYVFRQQRNQRGLKMGEDDASVSADSASVVSNEADSRSEGKKRRSRSKNDKDLNKYDQMVVVADFADTDDKLHNAAAEQIRGRVQDHDIIIDLEPVYQISFFNADTLLPKPHYYARSVEEFNNKRVTDGRLCLTNRELSLATDQTVDNYERIASLSKLIDLDQQNTSLYFARGTLNNAVMNYNNAINDYNVCLLFNPDDINALFNRAATRFKMLELIRSNEVDNGLAATPSLGSSQGGSVVGSSVPKVSYLEHELIVADLQKVLELDSFIAPAYFNLSLVMSMRGYMDDAKSYLAQAIKVEPEFAEAYFNLGIINIYQGDVDEGRRNLSKAGELGIYKAYNVIKRWCNE